MKRFLAILTVLAVVLVAFAACGGGGSATTMTMGTGGNQGTYYAYGGVLGGKLKDITGITVNVVSTDGSKANILGIDTGNYQLGTVKSDVITINAVQSIELKVLSAPVYQAVAVGKTAKITLDVQGEGLKYTWYYSLPGKTTFYKSSIADSEYKITLSADRVGRNVYCVITDAFGNSVQTETITLYAQ